MGKFSFLPQIRKNITSKNYNPSFENLKKLNKMIVTTFFDDHHTVQIQPEVNKIKTNLELSQQIGEFGNGDFDIMKDEEQKEYEKTINHLAYHDSLTDLPNRKLLDRKIESLMELAAETQSTFSILYLDLDRFRNINHTLGRAIGDKLIQRFSQRINELLKKSFLFSRFGGDEFGIVLWDYEQPDYPESIAKTIIDCLNEPFMIEDFELYITASIGISAYPSNGTTVEEIIKNADAALYRAKTSGKNNYQIYSSTINITSFKQYELERNLRKSIENNQLLLKFQPRVDTMSGKIVSAEALVRWDHPVWGLVSPNEFIPLAEETGFINEISDWVLKQVCSYLSEWKQKELSIVPISINVTADRFLRNDWKSTLLNTLKETNVDPSLIELEITETTLIQHKKTVESAFQYLKELGIKIALDDFGTGYSSLSHIKDFSIDTIKIDQSFIRQITKASNVEVIIKSLIFMAKGLNMKVVAEGVETNAQLEFLKQQECHEIQGFIYSKPVPEKMFQTLLNRVILKPIHKSENLKIQERRNFYRIYLPYPLSSDMTLLSINGKKVKLGKTEVLIDDIGPGGIKFLSSIQLPVRPDILFQFETTIMGEKIKLNGHIVWKNEVKDTFQYGLRFTIDENERDQLIKRLNHFSMLLKKHPIVPDSSFIKEEKKSYLKTLNSTK